MKKLHFIVFFLFFVIGLNAQNWNAFHYTYRYNYKVDGSSLISNVLFSDSVLVLNGDTNFFMNRIAVKCSGTCPTITGTVPVGSAVTNMPQFLQRKIIQKPGGVYFLYDTARFVISTLANPGQTWVFDTLGTVTASCVSKMQTNTFGANDSIKHIVLSTGDSIVLSYSFGILKFPEPFSKNKYYRLVGIENSYSYDSVALYGLKVPNAWDFYRYTDWNHFCTYDFYHFGYNQNGCVAGKFIYKNLASSGLGYSYNLFKQTTGCGSVNIISGPTNVFTQIYLSGKSMENTMYPGKVISSSYYPQIPVNYGSSNLITVFNIVSFALDTMGKFVKYAGQLSGLSNVKSLYTNYYSRGMNFKSANLLVGHDAGYLSEAYVSGMGLVERRLWRTGEQLDFSLTCASGPGGALIGHENEVGIHETDGAIKIQIYPNPVQEKLTLKTENYQSLEIVVTDVSGREIIKNNYDWKPELELDLSELVAGIYILRVSSNGNCIGTEKISKY